MPKPDLRRIWRKQTYIKPINGGKDWVVESHNGLEALEDDALRYGLRIALVNFWNLVLGRFNDGKGDKNLNP